jgi:hypothetical protein
MKFLLANMKKEDKEKQRIAKVKKAVSKANKGKARNPKGKEALFKLDMSFEEALKGAVKSNVEKV